MGSLLKLPSFKMKRISYAILLVIALVTGVCAYSLQWLNTEYSMNQFRPDNHPLYKDADAINAAFKINDDEPIIVTFQLKDGVPGQWLEPKRIADIKIVAKILEKVEGVAEVTSLTNFELAVPAKEGIQIGPLFSLLPAEQWAKRVHTNALLSPGLISHDGRVTALVVERKPHTSDKIPEIIAGIRESLANVFPAKDVQIFASGIDSIEADMTTLVGLELERFMGLAGLICFLTLVFYFRNLSSVLICLVLIVVSNIISLAWMVLSKTNFSILSTSLPILASITALAIGSHTLLNFASNWNLEKNKKENPDKAQVIANTCRNLFLPNLLMALTTSIGFATMGWSAVPVIRDFSWSVTWGIMLSWACISLMLPPIMYLFPIPEARRWTAANARWALFALRYKYIIGASIVLLVAGAVVHGFDLNWSVKLHDDLPDFANIKAAEKLVDEKLGGMIALDLSLNIKAEKDAWNDPQRVKKLANLMADWRKNPAVGSAIGLSDFLQTGTEISNLDSRQSIAELIFLYSLNGAKNPLLHFLNSSGGATRVALRLRDVPADEMQKAIDQLQEQARVVFPDAEVKSGGFAATAHPLNAELSRELIFGLWQSLLWITVLITLTFRSLRWAIVAAIPNLLAPLVLIATMSILQTPIKPVVAIIFSIALGIAYNNTVYLMSRLRQVKNNVDRAWYLESNPCLFSTLALLGGFAVFLSSYFSLNRMFGAYMLLSIGVGLFADLIFLPILLKVFPFLLFSRKEQKALGRASSKIM